jgi:hypothetical protein
MKVTVLYFENGTPRIDTLEFDILRLTKNSAICKAHGSFLNYLVSDKDAETFFIHRNVFNSLTNNSICQVVEKDFGVGGKSIWLATFKTM